MKKFLSIALAAMMLVSLFAVNVGAAPVIVNRPVTVYDYALNDFSNDTTFVAQDAESAIITYPEISGNKVLGAEFVSNGRGMYAVIEKGAEYTIEFDVYAVSQAVAFAVGVVTDDNPYHNDYTFQIPAYGLKPNTWYTYRITANENNITSASTALRAFATVERKEKGAANFETASHATALNSVVNGEPGLANTYRAYDYFSNKAGAEVPAGIEVIGFMGGNSNLGATGLDDTKYPATGSGIYYIDNLKVYHTGEVVDGIVDTVYVEQDYEDIENNTVATTGTGVTTVTEGNNTYSVLTGGGSISLGRNLGFDSYDDVEVTFDVRAMAPGALGIYFHLTADPVNTALPFVRTDEGMELEKWYRYKVIVDVVDDAKVPTIVRKNLTDGGDWVELAPSDPINNGTGDDTKYEYGMNSVVGNGQDSAIRFGTQKRSEQMPEGTVTANCVWHFDNLKVTSREFIKVSDVNATATTAAATVEFSKGGLYDAGTRYTVMMASYEGGVLADVAFEVVTADAGAVADVDLSVDITDDVRIYVWDANNTPLLTNVFDLSDYL